MGAILQALRCLDLIHPCFIEAWSKIGPSMDSLAGHLLIAIPDLPDSNFFRSVVLLLHHDAQGAAGVILNRPSNATVAQVLNDMVSSMETSADSSPQPIAVDSLIYLGGPVPGPLIALHGSLAWGQASVIPGLFVSSGDETLRQLIEQTEHPFKVFSGYSGWGPQQLEGEIDSGGWLTMPAEFDHVFAEADKLWTQACEAIGREILKDRLGINFPEHPTQN